MKIKDLKELIKDLPDNYEIRSRAMNAHLDNDEVSWQVGFSDVITKVKPINTQKIVMLIRGVE